MIRRRIDSEIRICDMNFINSLGSTSQWGGKQLEIEQIEPCGNLFIVEVFDKEPNSHQNKGDKWVY